MNAEQCQYIEQLYFDLYDRMVSYANSVLKNEAMAEEVVQESFQTACLKPEEVCRSENPSGWMLKTLKFTIQNYIRGRENNKRLLAQYLAVQNRDMVVLDDKVRLEVLYENVADLEEFQLIKEMVIEGKSHLEMAQARGISVSACKKRVQRAKEVLRKRIKP